MGSIHSCGVKSKINEINSKRPQHEFLTDRELHLLKDTWDVISKERQQRGIKIFLRIFQLAPETKNAFHFRNVPLDELTENVMFRSHATRFMRAVEATMTSLDALEVTLIPTLQQLGRRHTELKGFQPEHLAAFEQAMEEEWAEILGKSFTDETRTAWRKIFRLITSKVLEGYNQGTPPCLQNSVK